MDPRTKKIINSCFDYGSKLEQKNKIGWCATCDPDAKRGQRGYCGPGETSKNEEAPIIYPNSTNWGFCDPMCNYRNGNENMIQARSQELLNLSNPFIHHRSLKSTFVQKIAIFSFSSSKYIFWPFYFMNYKKI